jgi:hypothetical protein
MTHQSPAQICCRRDLDGGRTMFYIRAVSLRSVAAEQARVRRSGPQVRIVTRKPYGLRIPLRSRVASNRLPSARCLRERVVELNAKSFRAGSSSARAVLHRRSHEPDIAGVRGGSGHGAR